MRRLASFAVLALYATSAFGIDVLVRVVPVVGSTPGNFGSFFRTGVQFRNGGGADLNGHFVFHPTGRSAQSNDPVIPFSIPSDTTMSWDDIVGGAGLTGIGSLDMLLPAQNASSSPVLITRVYNDAGAAGTSGFTEDSVDPNQRGSGSPVLTEGTTGILIAPSDLTHFRFNVGIRTLSSGVGFLLVIRDGNGTTRHSEVRSYDPSFFEQIGGDDFAGVALQENDSIEMTLERGSVIVYGATTDNTTNDPSFQYARVVPRTN
ncbi:MAG TPA: hypothetical protein VH854_13230 [Thermoanaerobaculia bacterium]|jgi:hypothetical protein|nr:hypothetical protein [Thermoanaerobaculia bacterium]